MGDNSDASRDAIHEVLQRNAVEPGRVVTGWIFVLESMDGEGERYLQRGYSANLPSWTAKGFLHEALNSEWPDSDEED